MSKFRKDFVKDASFNFYEGKDFFESGNNTKTNKEKRIIINADQEKRTEIIIVAKKSTFSPPRRAK